MIYCGLNAALLIAAKLGETSRPDADEECAIYRSIPLKQRLILASGA